MNAHSLVHLSKRQWKRLEANSIHLTGMSDTNRCCVYNRVMFGKHITSSVYTEKKMQSDSTVSNLSRIISLDNVKRGVVAMTTTLKDLEIDISKGRVIVIDSTYRTATNDYIDNKYEPSEIILPGLISCDKESKGIMEWTSKHHKLMKKHKASIITSEGKHHGSCGDYYSYGNKANFGMVDLSSVAQYTSQKASKTMHLNVICLEELSLMEI